MWVNLPVVRRPDLRQDSWTVGEFNTWQKQRVFSCGVRPTAATVKAVEAGEDVDFQRVV
jgi:hypothetical protein